MLEKLESLRNKPKHIRNQYAFWTASVVTVCIALFWGSSLPSRFATEENQTAAPEVAGSSFFHTFGKIIQAIKESPNSLQGTVEYTQKENINPTERQHPLDLRALVASSTKAKKATTSESVGASSTVKIQSQKL